MKAWLVTIGEPVPTDEDYPRLHRNGILATYLLQGGHEVFWWNSTFDHTRKKQRFLKDKTIEIQKSYKIRFLKSLGYSKNISLARFIDHFILALKFYKQARSYERPDVILCSMPPVFLAFFATLFAKKRNIPIAIDLRDKWPDIFVSALPENLKFLSIPFILPFKLALKYATKNATALTGMTDKFVEWGCKYAGRKPNPKDKSFPFGYKATPPSISEQKIAFDFWKNIGIKKNDNIFTICFFGAIANQVVFETICKAFQSLEKKQVKVRLIFCGEGPQLENFKNMASSLTNIHFPGWINKNQIWTLMQISDAGLIPLVDDENFRDSFMNKSIEYMSANLPIICSVHGVLKDLIKKEKMGYTYHNYKPEELADCIIDMINNPAKCKMLRNNVKRVFKQYFTEEKVYKEMTAFIENLANN